MSAANVNVYVVRCLRRKVKTLTGSSAQCLGICFEKHVPNIAKVRVCVSERRSIARAFDDTTGMRVAHTTDAIIGRSVINPLAAAELPDIQS